jgi:hypothetical protein
MRCTVLIYDSCQAQRAPGKAGRNKALVDRYPVSLLGNAVLASGLA